MEEGVPGEWEAMQRDRFRRLTNNAAAQTNRRVASEDNGEGYYRRTGDSDHLQRQSLSKLSLGAVLQKCHSLCDTKCLINH
jgi:hypothetical protein